MAVANTLVGKNLLGVGIGGATIGGGGWIIFSPTSPLWRPSGPFKSRALQLMKHVGFEENWCTLDEAKKKYTCEKSKSKENLKKLNFYNHKKPGNNLRIFDDCADVEVEISETSDKNVFPYEVKFVFKNENCEIKIKEKKEGEAINSFKSAVNPEFKAIWGTYKLGWAWEDISNLANKGDLECNEKDSSCTLQPKRFLEIRKKNGTKFVTATIDKDKKIKFSRDQGSSYFQGFKFYVDEDIELKGTGGKPIEETSITKLEKDKSYQITSNVNNAWYLEEV